jgi:hypothetical protein
MGKRFLVLMYCLLGVLISCSKSAGPSPSQPKAQASPAAAALPASTESAPGSGVTAADIQMWNAGGKWLRRQTDPKDKEPVSFSIGALDIQGGNPGGRRPELAVFCQKTQVVVFFTPGPVTSGLVQYQIDDQPKVVKDWRILGGDTLSPRDETVFVRKLVNGKKVEILYDAVGAAGSVTFQTLNLKDLLSQEKSCKL